MTDEGLSFRGDESPAFTDVLASFKRNGCTLLVTGEVAEHVTARATRKLLGTPAEPRERVLALTDPVVSEPVTYLPGNLYPHHEGVAVVDYRDHGRDATDAGQCDGGRAGIDALRSDVTNELASRGRDLDAAQLRFGLVSLRPLLDAYADLDVTDLVTRVAGVADDANAMAHFHLRLPDDDPAVDELSPHVDARIELRQVEGMIPEQRWHVPDHDAETRWVTL